MGYPGQSGYGGGYGPPTGGGYGPPPGPPPGGGYGPPPGGPMGGGPHQEPASQGSAIGALIASIFGLCLCWPFAIAALVFAIIGLVKVTDNPDLSRKMTLVAWICFGVAAVAGILYWVVYVLLMGGSMMMT